MNIKKSLVTFTAAASLAVTGFGLSNLAGNTETHTAHAATTITEGVPSVVTTTTTAKLYTEPSSNSKLEGRSLAENTPWAVGQAAKDDAGNVWYFVGTNAWVRAVDVKEGLPAQEEATTQAPSTQSAVDSLINTAKSFIGTPYVWGGKTPSGFDCSGFTSYVYQQATGKSIGGYTVAQESAGQHESVQSASAGDLLFWGNQGSTYHVGIYLGNNQYIAAPQPGESVKVANISSYFMPSFAVKVL